MEKVEFNSERWLSMEDLPNEVWKQSRFKNYLVSNYGRIKSLRRVFCPEKPETYFYKRSYPERIVRMQRNKYGYITYRFSKEGKLHNGLIHQIVAEAFVQNPNNLPCVNHKNEDKSDNRVDNLEWCSASYNSNYGTCQQRRADSVREMRRNREIRIDQYTIDGNFVRHYSKKGEIDDAGYCLKTILRVCRKRQELSNGFVWRFTGDNFSKPISHDSKGGTIRKKVIQLSLDGEPIKVHDTLLDAALWLGNKNKRNGICQCCYGKKRQSYGYIWKYEN